MADINLKTAAEDTSLDTDALLFGADSQAASSPSVYKVSTLKTLLLGGGSLAVASGKTLTASNTLTLTGTDGSSVAFGAGGTVLYNGGALGTPSSGTLTNATGLPISGIASLGTGVGTALANATNATGGLLTFSGAFGTPASLTLTNATGLPVGGISATGTPSGTTYLRGDGSWATPAGGGGTPGGSDTQIQYNNAGSFGGLSQLTYSGGKINVVSAPFGLSGNISSAAWTTSGIRYANSAATLTDTSSSGTVAAAYTDLFGGNTIAASNSTTFTDYYTMFVSGPTAGTNVTMTNRWALGVAGNLKLGPDASGTNAAGTNVTVGGSRGTGTGAGGSIIFQVAPASGSSGTTQNALATALTIDSTRLATFAGNITMGTTITFGSATDATIVGVSSSLYFSSDAFIFRTKANANATTVVADAANTLALKNSTNPQIFRAYSTTASSGSYGYLAAGVTDAGVATADTLFIGTGGTGAALTKLALVVNGTTQVSMASAAITAQNHLLFSADNTYDIGASGATRPRTGYFATSVVSLGANDAITAQNDFPMLSCIRPSQTARFSTTFGNSNKYSFRVARSSSAGGGNFIGATDADANAVVFQGWVGATTVTNTPMLFRSYKWDGATSVATLAATEPVMSFANGTTTILQLRGDGLVQFAGTTSSFPALKQSSTTLQVRLADDSAYTTIDAQHRLQGTAPASATATGNAGDIRYDSSYIYVCTATNTWVRAAIATW